MVATKPLVSIVTPSFNQGRYIERTIRSVLCQSYSNIEYIIVDALSTDQTSSVLKKYERHVSRIIQEKDNGQSDAIDKGFRIANGTILAYLNSDDCYASERVVADVVKKLDEYDDIDLVYGRRYIVDDKGLYLHSYPFRHFNKEELLVADYISQECCFWTKRIYDRAGGRIDQNYQFAMDYELWLRFLEHGAKFLSIDSVFGLFRKHDEQKTEAAWKERGLPEIARLQTQYLGRTVSEKDMQHAYVAHYSGVGTNQDSREHQVYKAIWGQIVRRNVLALGVAPLDVWTVGMPLGGAVKTTR
jgi:glycosyltransferase involved in cell wall biosynthesis